MAIQPRPPSLGLQEIMREELQEDSNATLETAKLHLESVAEAAPGDSVARVNQYLAELEELIAMYHEHFSLNDVLQQASKQ